jgi:Amt family ammonium transporter
VKTNIWRHTLGVMALLPLSLSVFAQTPAAPAPATPPVAAAAAPATPPPPANINGSTIVQDDTVKPIAPISSSSNLKNITNASLTAEGASRGDTAWMIVATALVMLMTPGLALFYGGLVRSKNVLNTLMMSFVALGIITIQWMLWGYSVAFGPTPVNGPLHLIIASPMSWMGLQAGAGPTPVSNAPTIPGAIFMLFQMTFAIITPALISGAIAERMKFSAYCLFILLWATFFYDPLAHMVWDGGLIGTGKIHALDFAGGTVVHISSGISALTLCIMLGKRRGHGAEEMRPHNVPMVLIGVALLWFGWFGFNAGSELAADGVATAAFINTHIATAAAAMSWIIVEWFMFKKPTAVGFGSGAVAGLVAITPACGFVNAFDALLIGLIVSPICFGMIQLKGKLNRYDDALDVFGVHACGGMWGALATGLFANGAINSLVNSGGAAQLGRGNGPFSGQPGASWDQPIAQLEAIALTVIMAVVATVIIGSFLNLVMPGGMRAPIDDEENGLDVTEHGEEGYSGDNAGMPALAGVD